MSELEARVRMVAALDYAADGLTDGAHHKQWVIDQMVRALTGCPIVTKTAIDCNGKSYTYKTQGESRAYLDWVAAVEDGDEGSQSYEWDTGVAP